MDRETLLETAPLLQGRLRDQRNEICRGCVEWAVYSQDIPEEFEAETVIKTIESETSISFEKIQVNSVLEELVDEGNLTRVSRGVYSKRAEIELKKINSLVDDCWEEFVDILEEHGRDIDVHYIDSNIEPAFRAFFDLYVDEIVEETEILEDTKQDVMYTADVMKMIEDVAREYKVDKPDVFKECFSEFLKNPCEPLKEYVGIVYVAIVNSDLLSRQKSVDLPEVPEDEKKIFLDSNVIQDLLCETDNEFPLIRNIIERSKELGFDFYYFPETIDDLQRSINGAIREMGQLKGSNYSNQTFDNQFVKDWYRDFQENRTEWQDYQTGIQRWELEVETRYSIVEYEQDIECPEEEVEYAKDIIDRIDSERHKRPKKPDVLNHDASILAKTSHLRNTVSGKHNIGPLLLSLDNSVTQASDYAFQNGDWSEGISIPPRVWFNYLLTFTSADFDSIEVGEIILNISANIPSQPTIEQYSKAVEEKTDLGSGSAELLAKYLRYSAYSDEIARSLRRDDGRADELTFKALSDEETLEQFLELKENKKQVREMGKTIREQREEIERLRSEAKSGDTFVNVEARGGDAKSEAHSESEATATAEATAELQQDIDDFIDFYFEHVPADVQREVPPPPDDRSNLDKIREWLNVATTAVALAEPSTAALKAVSRWGNQLLEQIPK